MSEKIVAVVVTYNRCQWLLDCLQALVQQTRQPDAIVVVNNNSSDDTKSRLEEFVLNHDTTQWQTLHLPANTGGAGGFYHGMRAAVELGADYLWLMDDDVETLPNGLEDLLTYADKGDILHGRRKNPDGSYFYWQHRFLPWIGFSLPYADTAFNSGDICYPNTMCFEGALIKRCVVDKIGYPDPRYFIAWDDTAYGYQAAKYFTIAYCRCDVMMRKKGDDALDIGVRKLARPSDLYRYCHIRNRFLLIKTVVAGRALPIKLLMAITFHGFTLLLILKEMLRAILFKDWTLGIKPLFSGLWDGILGRFDSPSI